MAWIDDPAGSSCDHPHPVMVLHAGPRNFWGVGISSKFTDPIPAHWFKMPNAPGGHLDTGLDRPCVLKCNWLQQIMNADALDQLGHAPKEIRQSAIIEIAARIEDAKKANQAPKKPS